MKMRQSYLVVSSLSILCSDIAAMRKKQHALMQQFINPIELDATAAPLLEFFCHGQRSAALDPCQWRGVECDERTEIIQSLHITQDSKARQIVVHMDMLPPTVASLYLENIHTLNGWVSSRLPRELKYMCVLGGEIFESLAPQQRNMQLENLPRSMEELILMQFPFHGCVVVDDIPERMRILWIRTTGFQKVFVNVERLSDTLRFFSITNPLLRVEVFDRFGKNARRHLTRTAYAHYMLNETVFGRHIDEMWFA